MKVSIQKWEIERIKEIISDILSLWNHDFIEANSEGGASTSMSIDTFYEQLEKELNK